MRRNNWLMNLALLFLVSGCAGPVTPATHILPTHTRIPKTSTPTLPADLSEPTLSAEEAKSLVFDLLKNNGGCQLPCLWGLTPGKTDSQALGKFVSQLGNVTAPDIYVSAHDFKDGGNFFVSYRQNNIHIASRFGYSKNKESKNKIEILVLDGFAMQEKGKDLDWKSSDLTPLYGDASFNQAFAYYLLPQILSNYGRPSQVLLRPFLVDPQRPDIQWQPFSLVLFYPEKGIFVEYVSPRETAGSNYVGCPSKVTVTLAVWDPESGLSLKDIVKAGSQINELNMDNFQPIEKATSMTLEEFYLAFKDPANTTCLETPQKLWQP